MSAGPIPHDWLQRLSAVPSTAQPHDLSRFLPPDDGGRPSAVLMLFGADHLGHPDVLLTERAHDMRSHAGQVSFPGGSMDPDDGGPVEAALREAAEETGLDPAGVDVLGRLPSLYLPPSNFVVTPVLAWWRAPSAVAVMDPSEVARVERIPLRELLDPVNRHRSRHPSGYIGPVFTVRGWYVWGFTAGLLSRVLELAGLEQPWDANRVRDLPADVLARVSGRRAMSGNP